MPIKPIDLQVNIAQLPEVARGEHGRVAALIEGQHSLEEDAEEKARRTKDKLEENKQAEKAVIMKEEGFKKKKENKEREHSDNDTENEDDSVHDDKKGTILDLTR